MYSSSKVCAHEAEVFVIKIGDFSKLTKLPVKTIRYYADIGLLNPEHVNEENKYRQYGVKQLVELNRILTLKEAGFSLKEIIQISGKPMLQNEFISLLESKLIIAKHELLLATMKIANLETRIKHIKFEEEYKMVDVTVKKIEPVLVVSIRKKGVTPDEFSGCFGKASDDAAENGAKEIGAWICIRHSDDDWEACAQIDREYTSKNPDVNVYHLPAIDKMACVIHSGPWGVAMKLTIDGFFEWAKLNGLDVVPPFREIFHVGERENSEWSTFVTEMQYPIK
jgi:DNA-binding transcriptional MerR regulator